MERKVLEVFFKHCGSVTQAAKELGLPREKLSDIRNGREIKIEDALSIAEHMNLHTNTKVHFLDLIPHYKKTTLIKNQANEDEESMGTNNLINLPVKTKSSVMFTVPLRQTKTRIITEAELDEWQKNYPEVNVQQEIRQLMAWNQANPDRQKTQRGINRHIQGWLAHAQQKQSNNHII